MVQPPNNLDGRSLGEDFRAFLPGYMGALLPGSLGLNITLTQAGYI